MTSEELERAVERLEADMTACGKSWLVVAHKADLRLILAANRKMRAALAASPSVGGWEEPDSALIRRNLRPLQDHCRELKKTGRDSLLAERLQWAIDQIAAPPPVSTGSRPQEAVPTCDAEAAVVGPGGWLIKDFADGWFWTGQRIAAVAALTEGHTVFDIMWGEYAATPQPADDCSSNEGAK